MTSENSKGASALASVAQIEALADQLSAIADDIHQRVMADIRSYKDRPATDAEQGVARAMLEDEILLRQRANGLYADAASYVVQSLSVSQAELMKLTADAAEKIRKIGRIRDAAGLVGGLLMLAGAAASGQVAPIVVAIERVGKSIKKISASAPNKAA
jgi:hypothetical protein